MNEKVETSDFSTEGELSKELGLKEALTIGVGTMIGAGIFVLPGTALEISGPAAIMAYIIAGLLCMITAASTAELATGMPKSGGAYFFISRSMGGIMGTISGVSVWLSLTFAVAFYLQGFGEYLGLFLPLDSLLLAVIAGIFFTYINYIGAKETGKTQNLIVGVLLSILLVYVVWGTLHFDVSTFQPFSPYGIQPIFLTTAVIFVSFLGFVQIASVAEEVKEPGYTLPRAIIGSVAIVTVLYALVLAVTTGLLPLDELIGYEAPIVESARVFSGLAGGAAVTFAALLATASSANASILAASRISFALGRDNIFPDWLNQIHDKYMTPYRPILLTGVLTILLIVTADVELLSSTASVLMLINYSLLNITVLIMRTVPPEGYNPDFRSPGYPYLHIIGSLASLGVVFFAGIIAQIVAVALVVFSLAWYFAWAKNKTVLEGALSSLKPAQVTSIFKKEIPAASTGQTVIEEEAEEMEREIYRVLTPMANPAHEKAMLNISSGMVKSTQLRGEITLANVIKIPEQTPLDLAEYRKETLQERHDTYKQLLNLAVEFGEKEGIIINPRIFYSRSRFKTINNLISEENIDFLLLGWRGAMSTAKIYESLVNKLVQNAPCPVGVLKDHGLQEPRKILVPYRGSEHAYWGVKVARRLASNYGNIGEVVILRVIERGGDPQKEEENAWDQVKDVFSENDDISAEIKVVFADKVVEGIINESYNEHYDLIVMGASKEWRLKNMLFGSVPDIVAEEVETSVLMVRCYDQKIDEEIQLEGEVSVEEDDLEEELQQSPEKF